MNYICAEFRLFIDKSKLGYFVEIVLYSENIPFPAYQWTKTYASANDAMVEAIEKYRVARESESIK